MPSIFSAVQRDAAAMRRYLLNVTAMLALVGVPLSVGGALVAPVAVPLLLGAKWYAMIVPLQLLMVYAAVRSVAPLYAQVLQATGQARFDMHTSLIGALLLPVGFVIASRWGVVGIAAAWMVLHPLLTLRSYRQVARTIELSHRQYLRAVWPAASSALLMAVTVSATWYFAHGPLPAWALLALEVLVGAATYAGAIFALHRADVRRLLDEVALDPVRRGRDLGRRQVRRSGDPGDLADAVAEERRAACRLELRTIEDLERPHGAELGALLRQRHPRQQVGDEPELRNPCDDHDRSYHQREYGR
jgi:hypothetical protein